MKLAISNIAWNDNYEHYYQLMREYGYSGLEIAPIKFSVNPYDNTEVARLAAYELLVKYQLPIISMQALLFGSGPDSLDIFVSHDGRDRMREYLKKAILYAQIISCPVLVFGSPKNRVIQDRQRDYPIAIEFFKELGDFAYEHNTCLCIEPNPQEYGTNFINHPLEANQLVNDVNSKGFAMIVDTSTMLINQNPPEDAKQALANTRHIHISMPFLKPLNQEFAHYEKWFARFIELVREANYAHYLSIEMANVIEEDIKESLAMLSNFIDK